MMNEDCESEEDVKHSQQKTKVAMKKKKGKFPNMIGNNKEKDSESEEEDSEKDSDNDVKTRSKEDKKPKPKARKTRKEVVAQKKNNKSKNTFDSGPDYTISEKKSSRKNKKQLIPVRRGLLMRMTTLKAMRKITSQTTRSPGQRRQRKHKLHRKKIPRKRRETENKDNEGSIGGIVVDFESKEDDGDEVEISHIVWSSLETITKQKREERRTKTCFTVSCVTKSFYC